MEAVRQEYEEVLLQLGPHASKENAKQDSGTASDRLARMCLIEDACRAGVDGVAAAVARLRDARDIFPSEMIFGSQHESGTMKDSGHRQRISSRCCQTV